MGPCTQARPEIERSSRQLKALEGMAKHLRLSGQDDPGALSLRHEAYRLAVGLKKKEDVGRFLNSMAIIQWERRNYDNALNHYEEALILYRELGDDRKVGFILNSIAVTLRSLNRFEEAARIIDRALAVHHKTQDRLYEGQALAVLGHLHADQGRYTEALDAYQRCLGIRCELGGPRGSGGGMTYYIARIYTKQKQAQEGRWFMRQALTLASAHHDQKLGRACLTLEDEIAVVELNSC